MRSTSVEPFWMDTLLQSPPHNCGQLGRTSLLRRILVAPCGSGKMHLSKCLPHSDMGS